MTGAQKKNDRGVVPEGERCRGWSRTAGRACRQRRVPGSDYCHYHGGKNAKGGAHPNYKHGKRSRYRLPPELLANYERFLQDPDLAHHRNSVAILDSMIQEIFDNFDSAGSPVLWRQLRAAWSRAEAAREAGDERGWRRAYEEVGLLIERGVTQSVREVQAVSLMEKRRKHADSELKRETAEANTWTYEEAAAFYIALGTAVRKNVPDREQLMRIEMTSRPSWGGRRATPQADPGAPGQDSKSKSGPGGASSPIQGENAVKYDVEDFLRADAVRTELMRRRARLRTIVRQGCLNHFQTISWGAAQVTTPAGAAHRPSCPTPTSKTVEPTKGEQRCPQKATGSRGARTAATWPATPSRPRTARSAS